MDSEAVSLLGRGSGVYKVGDSMFCTWRDQKVFVRPHRGTSRKQQEAGEQTRCSLLAGARFFPGRVDRWDEQRVRTERVLRAPQERGGQ